MKRLLRIDWDVIAGITAALLAIVLHLLHVVHVEVLFTIILALVALLLFRDLRRENHDEHLGESVSQIKRDIRSIVLSLEPPEAVLIGPRHLRTESHRFVASARGDMVWYNVCFLMFRSQEVFDMLLKPAIESPLVESIQFISDESEQELWAENILPKIKTCDANGKILAPRWRTLPQTVSFILADTERKGQTEALLSFWGEPFMARTVEKQVPRYVFWVHGHSDLVAQFVDLERQHRM